MEFDNGMARTQTNRISVCGGLLKSWLTKITDIPFVYHMKFNY
jgi:hypothetical protein